MTTFARSTPGLGRPGAAKPRVLYMLSQYPQISETSIKNEIEALETDYEIGIVARKPAGNPYDNHRAYSLAREMEDAVGAVEAFRPDVLHTHYLTDVGFVGALSQLTGVPFTLRAHSGDVLALRPKGIWRRVRDFLSGEAAPERSDWFVAALNAIESEMCLGVLALPFARPWLTRAGVPAAKLVDCFPVLRFDRFHDRSPNGSAVMNIGAPSGGKAMADFLRLARKVPSRSFSLYADSSAAAAAMRKVNAGPSANVTIAGSLEPEAMATEYKKHRWLVCTGDVDAPSVGWPIAIAEAQAAGVGVCMPALRADLAQYVGEGAGVLYETIDELPAIVSGPVPEEMRERGFEQARKSDIERHKHLLTNLWDAALRGRTPDPRILAETSDFPPMRPAATANMATSA
jgi:hypothetical protein